MFNGRSSLPLSPVNMATKGLLSMIDIAKQWKEAETTRSAFAITDTNVDPTNIDYVIPMNDDAIKATKLVLGYFVEAIKEGKK